MSQHTPRTMSAEREAYLREYYRIRPKISVKELFAEIDAERAVSAELLEVCKAMLKIMDHLGDRLNERDLAFDDQRLESITTDWERVRALIAKAEPSPSDSQRSHAD